MNTSNFEALLKQFAAASKQRPFSVRLSLSNGETLAGAIAPQAPGQQGLPRMIFLRSPTGQMDGVEIADIVRMTGPFIPAQEIDGEIPHPSYEALQSNRGSYWYVDKRDSEGGNTVIGGPDLPLTQEIATAIANALNEAVEDYAALLKLSGIVAHAS